MDTKELFFLLHAKEQLEKGFATSFLNPREAKLLKAKLKQIPYHCYVPFEGSNYCCFYQEELPQITCFEILGGPCTHSEIMGSFFKFSLDRHLLGDIMVADQTYFLVSSSIASFLKQAMTKIGSHSVMLREVPLSSVASFTYQGVLETHSLSSLRLDLVLSKVTHQSRSQVIGFFERKEILWNYEEKKNGKGTVQVGDVFSIRHYGKYQIVEMNGPNAKGKWHVTIKKMT